MRDMYICVALFRELQKRHFTVEHNQSMILVILRLFVLVIKRNSVLCAAEYLTRGNRR